MYTRSHDERSRNGVIPGSVHIPRSVLWRLDPEADPAYRNSYCRGLDQWLVLVCANGCSTSLAAATLHDLGFHRATDLVGGFTAWQEHDLPVSPAPEVEPEAGSGNARPRRVEGRAGPLSRARW